jgi:tRNA G18 (ribose-2'-O)-methylase SpoU
MRGIKQSLNVSVATGIVGYEFARCYTLKQEEEYVKS